MYETLSLVCRPLFGHMSVFLTSTEDAKRLAIKEEQYDPGYEDAYGGAYAEQGPEEGQAQNQNGHCTFSAGQSSGNHLIWIRDPHELTSAGDDTSDMLAVNFKLLILFYFLSSDV